MRNWYAHSGGVTALAFSPDGRSLASAGGGNQVRIRDAVSGQDANYRGFDRCRDVAFSPDGRYLLVDREAIGVSVIDTESDRVLLVSSRGNHSAGISFSSDGRSFFNIQVDRVIEVPLGKESAANIWYLPELGRYTKLAAPPDGRILAVGGDRVNLYLLDPETGFVRTKLAFLPESVIRAMKFSPDGQMLAVSAGRSPQLFAVATGDRILQLRGHQRAVRGLAFSSDGRTLLTASLDGTVKAWEPSTGRLRQTLEWDIGPLTALAVAPDGLTAATAGESGRIVVWDLDGG
jgi:WD40 repeat protein